MKRAHSRIALAGVVVAAPMVLLLVPPGDWFDEDAEFGLNRNVEPPDLSTSVHVALGVLATAVLSVSLLVLLSRRGRTAVRREDVTVAVPLVLAGLYVALTYRVFTAQVSGANIGAGMLFMLGFAVVPLLIWRAGYNAWRSRYVPDDAGTVT